MSRTQRMTTDFIFVIGLSTAFLWCGAQAMRAFTSMEGVSLAQYVAFTIGFVIQLALALEARRKNRGRIISQQITLFVAWSTCSALLVGSVLIQDSYTWTRVDTTITAVAASGTILTLMWAASSMKSLQDAAVRAWINISLKSLPQFLLVAKIWSEGSAGITTTAIVLGSVSILSRLIPLSVSMEVEGRNRDKTWLWISDAVNLVSWLSVTVIWFIKL